MAKQFIGIWGAFEPGANWYLAPMGKENTLQPALIVDEEDISEDTGYEEDDIVNILALDIHACWHSPLGNHYLIRIVDKEKEDENG